MAAWSTCRPCSAVTTFSQQRSEGAGRFACRGAVRDGSAGAQHVAQVLPADADQGAAWMKRIARARVIETVDQRVVAFLWGLGRLGCGTPMFSHEAVRLDPVWTVGGAVNLARRALLAPGGCAGAVDGGSAKSGADVKLRSNSAMLANRRPAHVSPVGLGRVMARTPLPAVRARSSISAPHECPGLLRRRSARRGGSRGRRTRSAGSGRCRRR
jgi:hypothetical protein